jgi:hypothetical protein
VATKFFPYYINLLNIRAKTNDYFVKNSTSDVEIRHLDFHEALNLQTTSPAPFAAQVAVSPRTIQEMISIADA